MQFLFLIVMMVLLLGGIPAAFAIAATALFEMVTGSGIRWNMIGQGTVNGISSFTLLALPLFLLAGKLMNIGGITHRLFDFAKVLVGWLPGGLGHVNVIASLIFAGMSGSAVADAAGLGEIEVKAMRKAGYDDDFICSVTVFSSMLGPMVPPSLALVIYATVTGTSTGALFLAGVVPGLLMTVIMMAVVSAYTIKKDYPRSEFPSVRVATKSFITAVPALMTVVIILAGIYTGAFTATEAAAVAVAYAAFLAIVVYREMNLKTFLAVCLSAAKDTAAICIIIAFAGFFGSVLVRSMVPQELANAVVTAFDSQVTLLIAINLFLLVVGMFLPASVSVIILVPILLPAVVAMGVSPVHFGIIFSLNMSIGAVTPPFGILLFVMSKISGVPTARLMKAFLPWIAAMLFALTILTFMPQLTLWLPESAGFSVR